MAATTDNLAELLGLAKGGLPFLATREARKEAFPIEAWFADDDFI